jgi:serine/threonine protein kinase
MFYLSDKVGEGSFSQVFRGTNLNTHSVVAVKKVRVGDVKSKIARRLLECEVSILRELKHPHIIRCQDIHFSVNNCYIITEFCEGGNLDFLFKRSKSLPDY